LVSLFQGAIDDVQVYTDLERADDEYRSKVTEDYGSIQQFQHALEHGDPKTEFYLYQVELDE
ncbi:MAG: hypothetical protein KJ621_07600, partial [Proteobacteria bacterium]|nr:hypothetical protein [Pseudomonadota bacterium]